MMERMPFLISKQWGVWSFVYIAIFRMITVYAWNDGKLYYPMGVRVYVSCWFGVSLLILNCIIMILCVVKHCLSKLYNVYIYNLSTSSAITRCVYEIIKSQHTVCYLFTWKCFCNSSSLNRSDGGSSL